MTRSLRGIIILVSCLIVGGPLVLLLILSMAKGLAFPKLLPSHMTLDGYRYLLIQYPRMVHVIINSIKLSTIVASLSVLLGILAGRGLHGLSIRGRTIAKAILVLPLLIPIVSVAMGLHIVFIKLNFANKMIGVIIVQLVVTLPYAILIFSDLFHYLGDKWFEQGELYGAVGLKKFRYVTFPLLSNGIISAFSISFIISFSQYFVTLLIGGGRIKTFATEMFPFINGDPLIASSFSMIFLGINMLMFLCIEVFVKSFVKKGIVVGEG